MSSRILTHNITDIDIFMQDPHGFLNRTDSGTIAVFSDNTLVFYAITSIRLAKLLEFEIRLSRQINNFTLAAKFFEEDTSVSTSLQTGKFAMYSDWKPDTDFQKKAALWGITLTQPVKQEELSSFITWWKEEKGKVFTHIQWQQKLARSIQITRASNQQLKRDINLFSQPDTQIPNGFRGAK